MINIMNEKIRTKNKNQSVFGHNHMVILSNDQPCLCFSNEQSNNWQERSAMIKILYLRAVVTRYLFLFKI